MKIQKNMHFESLGNIITSKQISARYSQQLAIVSSVLRGHPLKTNKRKGNFGEMVMDLYQIIHSYDRLSLKKIDSLDDSIHQGLDGVYYKNTGTKKIYIIADAKYGSAVQKNTKDGLQLSDAWIDSRLGKKGSSNRLINDIGLAARNNLLNEVFSNQATLYRLLIHIYPDYRGFDYIITSDLVDSYGFVIQKQIDIDTLTI